MYEQIILPLHYLDANKDEVISLLKQVDITTRSWWYCYYLVAHQCGDCFSADAGIVLIYEKL